MLNVECSWLVCIDYKLYYYQLSDTSPILSDTFSDFIRYSYRYCPILIRFCPILFRFCPILSVRTVSDGRIHVVRYLRFEKRQYRYRTNSIIRYRYHRYHRYHFVRYASLRPDRLNNTRRMRQSTMPTGMHLAR